MESLSSKNSSKYFYRNSKWSNGKPNKLWFDQGKEFYYKLIQEWLDNSDI